MVNYHHEDLKDFIEIDASWAEWLSELCASEDQQLEEINVIFCSDAYLLEMNKKHLNHNYFTDIITFDYCIDNQVFGDLFISIERVAENAEQHEVVFTMELERVLAHGVLHLLGYGDKTPEEKKLMTSKEDFYLSLRTEQ